MSTFIKKNSIVLFQGDSITDVGHSREDDSDLGRGYASMISARFSAMYPEKKVKFLNRGISGNRVEDLKARWKEDCIDLKPDLVSILIGINNCWRRYDNNDPTSLELFERDYRYILEQIRNTLPDTKIILLEPFILPVSKERKTWREDLDPKIQVVRELAREYNTYYIPLDGIFAQVCTLAEPDFWAADGVHPTQAGHALISQKWLETIKAV